MAEDQANDGTPTSNHTDNPTVQPLGSSLIPIVNKLQDIFAQVGGQFTIADIPQVAVVGSQSSGKSSVLEALVGRDFLPRGSDICTRRPLVLQLVTTKRTDSGDDEWGEFLHLKGIKFYNFAEIRQEIQSETEREAGANKGVSHKQIRLKIFSPNVLDITLVDLPGITKVPVGDQPSDIEAQIRTMIMGYIKNQTCLILAVTPANADLANSDALQMAGAADPDGKRTIGVITKLDIMDRGTDARNFLLGKVIPLKLGYVGVVNRSQEDIIMNRSIKDALDAEEKFFRTHAVYSDIADRCGIPQLAKKLNQLLVQHIKTVLPGLKEHLNKGLTVVAKEHARYGEVAESKGAQGAVLLNILSKYSEEYSSMIEGKNEEMSTDQLSGGARIHYIFQNIFVKSLEEVDPCEDLTDNDIRTAIHNATGLKSALFVPEVPFEVLVRRQIARLLDPSLQCARFIYEELIKMSRRCNVPELQRFPVLKKRIIEVTGNCLREFLIPTETMIDHLINVEMDYINTSNPRFIGGSKAVEIAKEQVKNSRIPFPIPKQKEPVESEKGPASERSLKSRAILSRPANGIAHEQTVRPVAEVEKPNIPGNNTSNSSWGISAIFGGSDNRSSTKDNFISKPFNDPIQPFNDATFPFNNSVLESSISTIQLREPPAILRPEETYTDQDAIEITVIKLLLKSYYDIVRNNAEDFIPKTIMHFLVNHTKRELHNVFIKKLYRDNLFEEMLQEPDEISVKRKLAQEKLCALQQALRVLDELPFEAETIGNGYSYATDCTGLPKIQGFTTSSFYNATGGSRDFYGSPKKPRGRKTPSHSGELHIPAYGNVDSNGSSVLNPARLYPSVDQ